MAAIRRTYLAGVGAGISLLAGGALLFMVLSSLVAFDAMPDGGEGEADVVRTADIPEDAVLAAADVTADVPAQIATALATESATPAGEAAAAPPRTLDPPPARSLPRVTDIPGPPDAGASPLPTTGVTHTVVPDHEGPTKVEELDRGLSEIVEDGSRNIGKVVDGAGDTVKGLLSGDSGATRKGLGSTVDSTGKTVDDAVEGTGSLLDGTASGVTGTLGLGR